MQTSSVLDPENLPAGLESATESNRAGRINRTEHAVWNYPTLYQINTRVLPTDVSRALRRPATLDDIPDADLDRLAGNGFDWIWLLGVWQTGAAGRKVSLENLRGQREFQQLLPDFSDQDICGSCFAIRSYEVHSDFGGNSALERLSARGRMLVKVIRDRLSGEESGQEESTRGPALTK